MTDDERESMASGSDSPLTRMFRELADAADAPDGAVGIVDLARQFDDALGPVAPPEDSEPQP